MAIELDPSRWMVISDLQIPFEHPDALDFVKRVKSHFRIPDSNMICGGDELDEYWASAFLKDPNRNLSDVAEIALSKERLKEWTSEFKQMKVCVSNHGIRYQKRVSEAGLPSCIIKPYHEIFELPETWVYQDKWLIKAKHPFVVEHGDRYSGPRPEVKAAMHNGISTAIVHHHSLAQFTHIKTQDFHPTLSEIGFDIWGAVGGSLIDFPSYAYQYAHKALKKPKLGLNVIVDNGKYPLWTPL